MSQAALPSKQIKTNPLSSPILMNTIAWLLPVLLIFSRAVADITLFLFCLAFVFKSYQNSDWAWAKQTWFRLSLLFWIYLLTVNSALSIDRFDSFLHALFFIRWPLFAAAIAYWLFLNQTRQRHFLIALLATILFVMLDSSLQYFTGRDLFGHELESPTRLTGPYTRPIPGIMMLRVLFIGLFAALILPQFKSASRRITFVLLLLCIGLKFMFITGERMALMLFSSGAIVVLFGLYLEQKKHQTLVLCGTLIILFAFISTVLLFPEVAERSVYSISNKLNTFANSDYGVVFRAAIAAWQENPLWGSGFHTYKSICNEIGLLAQWGAQWNMQCTHPHNLYLQLAAETGLFGLILFSLMISAIYIKALNQHFHSKQWLITSLSFTILTVCFWPLIGGISLFNNGVAALVWLGVGWVLSVNTMRTKS